MRTVKAPEVRRAEILAVANTLFRHQGYNKTAVDEIVRQVGIAKGTFYHYFKSKEDILDALTEELVIDMANHAKQIVENNHLNAIEKITHIISEQNRLKHDKQIVVDSMHLPDNQELHNRINIKIVQIFAPILADVIKQGNQEALFEVEDPLSTIQFILAGSLFLFGEGIFNWTPQEEQARTKSMLILIERTFAAKSGTMIAALNRCIGNDLS